MKKTTKSFLIICLALIMLLTNMPVYASNNVSNSGTITPRWSHVNNVIFSFQATSSGGYIDVSYDGYEDSFAKANVHVKLQKKFLLVFWTDVDEWSSSSTDAYGLLSHVFELNGTGTYRAIFTFEVTGTDGSVDNLTDTIESKYSN